MDGPPLKIPAVKLLLLGDSGVGKSSLMFRYAEGCFNTSMMSTAGVDFKDKIVTFKGQDYRISIWDTAGQERFKSILPTYYRGAMGVLLVYDVTDANSFKNIGYWMENIQKNAKENVHTALVANKIDLERAVSQQAGRDLAQKYHVPYIETSAKDGRNVEKAFVDLAYDIVFDKNFALSPSSPQISQQPRITVDLNDHTKRKKICC